MSTGSGGWLETSVRFLVPGLMLVACVVALVFCQTALPCQCPALRQDKELPTLAMQHAVAPTQTTTQHCLLSGQRLRIRSHVPAPAATRRRHMTSCQEQRRNAFKRTEHLESPTSENDPIRPQLEQTGNK